MAKIKAHFRRLLQKKPMFCRFHRIPKGTKCQATQLQPGREPEGVSRGEIKEVEHGSKILFVSVFSLFNVVVFPNTACQSTSSTTSGSNRNGTCLTSSECATQGGSSQGTCAAGYGNLWKVRNEQTDQVILQLWGVLRVHPFDVRSYADEEFELRPEPGIPVALHGRHRSHLHGQQGQQR